MKDTDKFEIYFYKEQDDQGKLLKKFIQFENGGFSFTREYMKPAALQIVTMKPENPIVGEITKQEVTFKTTSQLVGSYDGA